MKRSKVMMNRLLIAAPWVTVGVLVVMSIALPNRVAIGSGLEVRKRQISESIDAVPFFIGRWVGEKPPEEAIPREAQKLLKPTGILNRVYSRGGGPWVQVLVVHCNDSRDMLGHYPPNCYPSAGWLEEPSAANPDLTLTVQNRPFPVREYQFKRYLNGGEEEVIRIFSAFILPDGSVTPSIDDMNRLSERLSVAVQGVAQLQLICPARVPAADAREAAEEILNGMTVLLDALDVGRGASE